MTPPLGPASELGPAGEAEWERLRAQIELASGFWLGFVLVAAARQAVLLRERAEAALRARGESLILIRPETPDALRSGTLPQILERADVPDAGCTWVEAVRTDAPGAAVTPWQDAWEWLFQRANEKRDAMRAHLRGGLVLALPRTLKPKLRETAPDLWSVRSIVLETSGVGFPIAEVNEIARGWDHSVNESAFLPLRDLMNVPEARSRAAEAERKGSRAAAGHAHLHAAASSLAGGDAIEAKIAAEKAAQALRDIDLLGETEALIAQARAELRLRNAARASDLAFQAIEMRRQDAPENLPVEWLDVAGRALLRQDRIQKAEEIYADAEALARIRLRKRGTLENKLDLFVALDGKADASLRKGDIDKATLAYMQMALVSRELAEQSGDAAWTLRLAAYSMTKTGRALRLRGEAADALACFEEAAQIWEEAATEGTALEPLRERSIVLNRIGELKLEAEDVSGAIAAFEESVKLRRALTVLSDSAESLQLLGSSLRKLATARERAADWRGAQAAQAEAEKLDREANAIDPTNRPRTFR